MADFVPVVQIH